MLSSKLQVRFQFLHTYWAKNPDASIPLFLRTHETIHQTFIIDTVAYAKHMPKLVNHDVAPTLYQILFIIFVFNSIKSRIISMERKSSHANIICCPAKAKVPALHGINVFVRKTYHTICIIGFVSRQSLQETLLSMGAILNPSIPAVPTFYLCVL